MKTPELIVSAVPHVHGGNSIQKIMMNILIALVPAMVIGVYFFGVDTIRVVVIAMASAVAWEAILQKIMGRPIAISNLSGAVSGLILAMLLPPTAPWWMICTGTFVMILLGKEVYGGLGNNPFNGVLIAWVVLQMSYPDHMMYWVAPPGDFMTEATPLEVLKFEGVESIAEYFSTSGLLIGNTTGFIGEVSALMLLIGGAYLLIRKVVSWRIPVSFLAGIILFSGLFWLTNSEEYASPLFHLLAGGSIMAAFFLATDMTSSPVTPAGMLIYGFLCGVLTVVIRLWGAWADGAYYAVFIISILTPLLDKIKSKVYGR
ncbi:MAG: RnfABCDGE type electron transport complex subunit D [Pseudomonadota bacterium]